MMSSCCTFRLKRRRAFSSDSPSCNLTSANETTPPDPSNLGLVFYCKLPKQSQELCGFCHKASRFSSHHPATHISNFSATTQARSTGRDRRLSTSRNSSEPDRNEGKWLIPRSLVRK